MKKLMIAGSLIKFKLFNQRIPLFVSWIITNKCNYSCAYCNPPQNSSRELTTDEALLVINELAKSSTKRISFTGGEPLLRADLGRLISECSSRGIMTSVNSNGSLVAQRIDQIHGIDILNLSLDGPEAVHDAVRGRGSFRDVIRAVEIAQSKGLKTAFFVTLSRLNLGSLDFFLDISMQYKSRVFFQPSELNTLRSPGVNPHACSEREYRTFIEELIVAKARNRFIGNSISGLKHLSCWPHKHSMAPCYGGLLFCRIDANGDVKICGRANGVRVAGNVLQGGFRQAFDSIKVVACESCWCGYRIEFNYILNGDLKAIINFLRIG